MDVFGSNNQSPSHQAPQKEANGSSNEPEPALVNEQFTTPKQQPFDASNTDMQSLCSRASEFQSQDSQYVTVNTSNNEQDPLTIPLEERQKLARAKRNREAAYRSRAKNKIRQCAVEEDTRKNLAINHQLRNMLEFLLARLRRPSASEALATSEG